MYGIILVILHLSSTLKRKAARRAKGVGGGGGGGWKGSVGANTNALIKELASQVLEVIRIHSEVLPRNQASRIFCK